MPGASSHGTGRAGGIRGTYDWMTVKDATDGLNMLLMSTKFGWMDSDCDDDWQDSDFGEEKLMRYCEGLFGERRLKPYRPTMRLRKKRGRFKRR